MTEFISLAAAVELVQDGNSLALGGMTVYRRPVGFVRALLRRQNRPRDLTLVCFTAGIESDLLLGAGCACAIRSCYVGLEAFGFAPMFTEMTGKGQIRMIEETEASFSMGLRARMSGVGFMPSHAWIGTDLPNLRPDVRQVIDPYSGETLMAFPAISIDVAVIHATAADRYGNVLLNNNLGVDTELVFASETVIVTAERIVDDELKRTTEGLLIPTPGAHYIAEAPRGAYPTSCYPDYPLGGGEFLRYVDACNAGEFDAYLAEFIAG